MKHTWLLAPLIALTLLVSSVATAEVFDRIAARVNDDIITLHDVRLASPPFLLQRGLSPAILRDPSKREKLLAEVLSDLIDRKLILQEANKMDQRVSDEEVEQWMSYTRQQQRMSEAQFRAMLDQFGMEPEDYRELVREQLLRMRITRIKVGSKVSVSDAEVEQAYRARYGDEPFTITYYTISHVLVQPTSNEDPAAVEAARARIERAQTRLQNGEDFRTVAAEESDGPSAKSQGSLGTFRKGELDPEFETYAFKLRVGELSPIVQTRFGFHIIRIDSTEERPNPDADERRDILRGELQQKAGERMLKSYLQNLRAKAYIKTM
jgi:peptidyl-prolyl cis-trans isomerase SurA